MSNVLDESPKLLLIGGGGHCRSCIDVIEAEDKYRIVGIVNHSGGDRDPVLGYEVLGDDSDLPELLKKYPIALITVGQIKSPILRKNLFSSLKEKDAHFPIIISPHACVSQHTELQEGTIVMHGAIVNAGSTVGKNCIINTSALVEHDAVIEDHCHISTASVVNGGTRICKNTFIGSNTVTKENITIGMNSVIGGGLRVMCDLPENTWMKTNENNVWD